MKAHDTNQTNLQDDDFSDSFQIPIVKTDAVHKRRVQDEWTLPWKELEVALGIENLLALRQLNISTLQRASDFLRECGFDADQPQQRKAIEQYIGEAL